MSYYELPTDAWAVLPAGTPGAALAPVPGWGMNPARSGPPMLAMEGVTARSTVSQWTPVGASDSEEQGQQGMVALAAAGGIFTGWALAWIYWSTKKPKRR